MAEALREERAAYDDVRALRFTLVDEQGTVRAALGPGRDGGVGMQLVDARGNPSALLTEDADGGHLHLFEREGRPRGVPVLRIGPYAADADPSPAEAAPPPPRRRGRVAALVVAGALVGALGGMLVPRPA